MIAQYWHTVRHLELKQVVSRVRLRTAAKARASFPAATKTVYARRVDRAALMWREELLGLRPGADAVRRRGRIDQQSAAVRAAQMSAGQFEFLNERADLGCPPDWNAPSKSRLWRFHLHYFDDLPDIAMLADPRQRLVGGLIDHWIAANPLHGGATSSDAWHPYVVSLRLVNWMLYLSATGGARDIPLHVRHSLVQHAVFLERNLETDLGGNHLLKNFKALVFAGCFWGGLRADRWRNDFTARFVEDLGRQVLPDGGHCERSPMYHAQVLCDAIEVAAVLRPFASAHAATLHGLVHRMSRFAAQVTHPDGEIALFNDSAMEVSPTAAVLNRAVARLDGRDIGPLTARLELSLARVEADATAGLPATPPSCGDDDQRAAATASGYVAVPAGRPARFLIADVGALGPANLPGHGHSDLLSFELSVDGRRLVVDSGVGEYESGAWRDYYRSTRAHNTVVVDGCEQSDCWGSFRVGRRASPANVEFTAGDGWQSLQAEHTGYDYLDVRHRRRFVWSTGDFWIVGDTLVGSGRHRWWSFCHLHPDASVVQRAESHVRVVRDRAVVDICWFGIAEASFVRGQQGDLQGWYAPRFGPPSPSTVLVLEGSGTLPARFGYAIVPRRSVDEPPSIARVMRDGAVEIRGDGHDVLVDLAAPNPVGSAR